MDAFVDFCETDQDDSVFDEVMFEDKEKDKRKSYTDDIIMEAFDALIRCPIATTIIGIPSVGSDGYVYEDSVFKKLTKNGHVSPFTRATLAPESLPIPLIKNIITELLRQKPELQSECMSNTLFYCDNTQEVWELLNNARFTELKKYKEYRLATSSYYSSFCRRLIETCSDEDVLMYVLTNTVDIATAASYMATFAYYCKSVKVFEYLKSQRVELNVAGDPSYTKPTLYFAANNNTLPVIKFLVECGLDMNAGSLGTKPINICHKNPSIAVMKYVVENTKNEFLTAYLADSKCPIYQFLTNTTGSNKTETEELVVMFLERKVDVTIQDSNGWTLLHYLIHKNMWGVLTKYSNMFTNLEAETKAGWRPIHIACRYSSAETIDFLLSRNVKVNVPVKEDGSTMAHDLIEANGYLDKGTREIFVDLILGMIHANPMAVPSHGSMGFTSEAPSPSPSPSPSSSVAPGSHVSS